MSFEVYPIESEHAFTGEENQFLCSTCHRPRAMHYRYHFHAKADADSLFQKPFIRFGRHPRFTPPGRMSDEPMPEISPRLKANAQRIRQMEQDALKAYLSTPT